MYTTMPTRTHFRASFGGERLSWRVGGEEKKRDLEGTMRVVRFPLPTSTATATATAKKEAAAGPITRDCCDSGAPQRKSSDYPSNQKSRLDRMRKPLPERGLKRAVSACSCRFEPCDMGYFTSTSVSIPLRCNQQRAHSLDVPTYV